MADTIVNGAEKAKDVAMQGEFMKHMIVSLLLTIFGMSLIPGCGDAAVEKALKGSAGQ